MRQRVPRAILFALLAASSATALCGCRKALFTERDVRSQYDRYDRVRNQHAPPLLLDEFGDEVPNIRGRLAPK